MTGPRCGPSTMAMRSLGVLASPPIGFVFVLAAWTGVGGYAAAAPAVTGRGADGTQGKPVIHTCRKGELDEAHFDVEHMNFIEWEEPEDLRVRVKNRILGTIGEGPHRRTKP